MNQKEICDEYRVNFLHALHVEMATGWKPYFPGFGVSHVLPYNCNGQRYEGFLLFTPSAPKNIHARVSVTCSTIPKHRSACSAHCFTLRSTTLELQAFVSWIAQAFQAHHSEGSWETIKQIPITVENGIVTFSNQTKTVYSANATAARVRNVLAGAFTR